MNSQDRRSIKRSHRLQVGESFMRQMIQPIAIFRCKWCIRRIGGVSWFNANGQAVDAPEIRADEISDGICPECFKIVEEEIKRMKLEKAVAQ